MPNKASKKSFFEEILMGKKEPPPDATLTEMITQEADSVPKVVGMIKVLFNQRSEEHKARERAEEALAEMKKELDAVRQPPQLPAEVLRVHHDEGCVDVVCSGRRMLVRAVPELELSTIEPGDEVLLDHEGTTAVRRNNLPSTAAMVVTVSEPPAADGSVVLRGAGEEEMVGVCPSGLVGELEPGDRVLVRRESLSVTAKLPDRQRSDYELASPPDVTFDQIGGLADVVGRIRNRLALALEHRAVAARFGVRNRFGLILVGPPGVGKTLFASAVCNYLAASGRPTSFLNVKPGELRGMYYGQAESRIRELFRFARNAPGTVVMFMDELESYGVRGDGHSIDGRVLAALLAEMSGLESTDDIFVIAATNRIDLCDDALTRKGRFGDCVVTIPRPDAGAARQILAKHLDPTLPYGVRGTDDADVHGRDAIIEAAVSHAYDTAHGYGSLATVVFADAEHREILPRDVVSGALLAGALDQAREAAALRDIARVESGVASPECGLLVEDVLTALDDALDAETVKLSTPAAARRLLDIAEAAQIVRVEPTSTRRSRRHRFLRAA